MMRSSNRSNAATPPLSARRLAGPLALSLLPAAGLAAYSVLGKDALVAMALVAPAAALGLALTGRPRIPARDGLTGLADRTGALDALQASLDADPGGGRAPACIAVEIDDLATVERTYGAGATEKILARTADRIASAVRGEDLVARIGHGRFAIVLSPPLRWPDLETMIELCGRVQDMMAHPISLDATRVYISGSLGFCLATRVQDRSAAAFLSAAETALEDAKRQGPAAIRAYGPAQRSTTGSADRLDRGTIRHALDNGEIVPFFQPQISARTGDVVGFETLARWQHPDRGVLAPKDFLDRLMECGLAGRLGEVMLYGALTAIRDWDAAGLAVERVGVNFSADELADPKLADRVRWELDRFEVAPERLCVEILEDVVASAEDDTVTRSVRRLRELGCGIDLDDFGVGQASLSGVRRFAVSRIKIDRSFVTRVDTEREQQDMVAAIVGMAGRLGLDSLAEGVETLAEHRVLADLGCDHLQGFSVGRPMPVSETRAWIERHRTRQPAGAAPDRAIG